MTIYKYTMTMYKSTLKSFTIELRSYTDRRRELRISFAKNRNLIVFQQSLMILVLDCFTGDLVPMS